MGHQALYRVWRPQTFADVVGQEHITKTLQNALLKEKVSHAYLFTGPRGTGKTSAAKIIAKAVNCEAAPAFEPCNECGSCVGITNGSISDVIEIDAASNNGVDEIRDIRDRVNYAPSAVRFKVYIIDEVHMLSTGAFNALLKTLEEPPAHVLFILATTEPHKIPLTIISRCQRFDFRRIPRKAIVERMHLILGSLKMGADDEALKVVAQASEGGMRDALSLLDQVLSFSDRNISLEDVLALTGSVSRPFLSEVAEAVSRGDTARAIQVVETVMDQGKDPVRFLEDLIYYYRDLLLYQTSPDLQEMLERAQVDECFQKLSDSMERTDIYHVIQILNGSQQEMKWTNHPRIFLELAMVKCCQGKKETKVKSVGMDSDVFVRLEKLEGKLNQLEARGISPSSMQPKDSVPGEKPPPLPATGKDVQVAETGVQHILNAATKQCLELLQSRWPDVMEQLRKKRVSTHACLIESQPVACSEDGFLLSFKYEIHCQMIKETKNREAVEQIVQDVYGKTIKMFAVPADEWAKLKNTYIQNQQGTSTENPEKPEDPLITEAERLFGRELIRIKDQ